MSSCSHACRLWPKLLYRGPESTCNNDFKIAEGCAIASEITMKGIVLSACAALGRPIVVIEEIPKDCPKHPDYINDSSLNSDIADEFFRLESTVFYESSGSVCKCLRGSECEKENKCEGQCQCQSRRCYAFDARMAKYLLTNASVIQKASKKALKEIRKVEFEPFIGDDDFPAETFLQWFRIGELVGIRYLCPMSGYSEFAFLLDVGGLRGVMIIGQILFKDEKVNKLQDRVLVEELLKAKAVNQYSVMDSLDSFYKFIEAIRDSELEESFYKNRESKKNGNCEEFLQSAAEVIEKQMLVQLNSRLNERDSMMRRIIISEAGKAFNKGVEKAFKDSFPEGLNYQLPDKVNELYGKVCDIFKKIMENSNAANKDENRLDLKDYMGLKVLPENVFIDPEKFSINTSVKKFDLSAGFTFNKDKSFDYSFTGELFGTERTQITFKRVTSEYDYFHNETKMQKDINEVFSEIYRQFSLVYEALHAHYQMLYNKAFTASMRHELGQVHQGMLLALKQYEHRMDINISALDTVKDFDVLRKYQLKSDVHHLRRDFNEYLHESVLRVNSTRYMDIIPEPIINRFLPFDAFLFKWNAIYRRRVADGLVGFAVIPVSLGDSERPYMNADRDMMEQVAYNLTNNAFKYSRPGTQIVLDCRLSADRRWYELIVTNYGIDISEDEAEKLGEYGFRGSNHDGNEGSGLGLWHCNEIAKKHCGQLVTHVEHISEFDISALILYQSMNKDDQAEVAEYLPKNHSMNSAELNNKLSSEIERLQENCSEHWRTFNTKIPKINRFTPLYVAKILYRGTAKFTFTVQIPAERKD